VKKPLIAGLKDGPLILKNLKKRIFLRDKPLDGASEAVSLCRCGKSSSMPFCDGGHTASGYKSEAENDPVTPRTVNYKYKDITVHDTRIVCSHDGSCFRELPEVFRPREFKWVKPSESTPEKIIETVKKCPSGSLSVSYKGEELPDPARAPAVRLDSRGPLNAEGGIEFKDSSGLKPFNSEHYALCRCGKSANKPFCDGTHLPGMFSKK